MGCGKNIVYFRKKLNITQEALAEKLDVSRQTVSKWENDSAFPETEKLIEICDLFDCSMDLLLRQDAENVEANKKENIQTESEIDKDNLDKKHPSMVSDAPKERIEDEPKESAPTISLEEYNKHMDRFSLFTALGVFFILLGVSMLCIFNSLNHEILSVVLLLTCIASAVAIFIPFGIWHDDFLKNNYQKPSFPKETVNKIQTLFSIIISIATFLVFVGFILVIVFSENEALSETVFSNDEFSVGIFLFIIGIATFMYVFAGIQHEKIEPKKEKSSKEKKGLTHTICGIIMLCCTAIFLFCGFVFNIWHPSWIVFPIGGITCGIVSKIFDYKNHNNKDE